MTKNIERRHTSHRFATFNRSALGLFLTFLGDIRRESRFSGPSPYSNFCTDSSCILGDPHTLTLFRFQHNQSSHSDCTRRQDMAVSKKRRTTRKRKRKNVNTSAVKIGPKPKRRRQTSAPNSHDSSLPNTAKLEDEQNQSAKLDDKKSKESSPVTSTSKVMSKKNPQGRPAQSTSPQTSPQPSQLENNVDVSSDDEESVHSETSQTESTSSIPSVIQSESPLVIPRGPRLDSYRPSPDFGPWIRPPIRREWGRNQPIHWDERDDLIGCHHDSKLEAPVIPKPINVDVRASKPQPSICYTVMRSWCFMIQLVCCARFIPVQ